MLLLPRVDDGLRPQPASIPTPSGRTLPPLPRRPAGVLRSRLPLQIRAAPRRHRPASIEAQVRRTLFTHTAFGTRTAALERADVPPFKTPRPKIPKRKSSRKQRRPTDILLYPSSLRVKQPPSVRSKRPVPGACASPGLVQCPKCPSPVPADRLQKHLRKKHGVVTAALTKPEPAQVHGLAHRPSRKTTKRIVADRTAKSRAMRNGSSPSGLAEARRTMGIPACRRRAQCGWCAGRVAGTVAARLALLIARTNNFI